MLSSARLVANLKGSDVERTIAFYEGKLGLPLAERREILPGHREALFQAGGAVICVEESGSVPVSGHTPVVFEVDDIEPVVRGLRELGVTFEDYDYPSLKTVDGVASVGPFRAAWFKDPDGNLLGLMARV